MQILTFKHGDRISPLKMERGKKILLKDRKWNISNIVIKNKIEEEDKIFQWSIKKENHWDEPTIR